MNRIISDSNGSMYSVDKCGTCDYRNIEVFESETVLMSDDGLKALNCYIDFLEINDLDHETWLTLDNLNQYCDGALLLSQIGYYELEAILAITKLHFSFDD